MRQLLDFLPLLVFFAVYQYSGDIILATGALILATLVQLALTWILFRRLERMHLITLAAVVFFGGLTIALDSDLFIKWKPTVVNWTLAVILLLAPFFSGRNLLERMLAHKLDAPAYVWQRLNQGWIFFFAASGALNLYVAFSFSQEAWVNFKVFGLFILTLLASVASVYYLHARLQEAPQQGNDSKGSDTPSR